MYVAGNILASHLILWIDQFGNLAGYNLMEGQFRFLQRSVHMDIQTLACTHLHV